MKTIKFRAKTKNEEWIYNLAPLVPFSVFDLISFSWWERFKNDIEVIGNRYDNQAIFEAYAK